MFKKRPIRYVEEKDLGFHEHFWTPTWNWLFHTNKFTNLQYANSIIAGLGSFPFPSALDWKRYLLHQQIKMVN